MDVFVDESGIHKYLDHSVFALVYVVTKDREALEHLVLEIEQACGIDDFHWADHGWKVREKFLRKISRLPFSVKIAIFQNPVRPAEALEWSLLHLLVEKGIDRIHIDGKQPRWVERKLKKVLRDKGISVGKLRTDRHRSSPGIRVADALAGLSRAYYDNPKGKARNLWGVMSKKITAQILGGQADE